MDADTFLLFKWLDHMRESQRDPIESLRNQCESLKEVQEKLHRIRMAVSMHPAQVSSVWWHTKIEPKKTEPTLDV